jgi:hypothetical protein
LQSYGGSLPDAPTLTTEHLPLPPAPLGGPPPSGPTDRGGFRRGWSIVGIVVGFIYYIVPGIFAVRSYRRWRRGDINRPTFALVCAWIGVAMVVYGMVNGLTHPGRYGFGSPPSPSYPPMRTEFVDGFDDSTSGWSVIHKDPNATADYSSGAFRITYASAGTQSTAVARLLQDPSLIVSVQIDVTQVSATTPPLSSYGVSCLDAVGNQVFSFVINPADGEWRIETDYPETAKLAEGFDENIVHGGAATNRIRGVCDSRTDVTFLDMYVNDQRIGSAYFTQPPHTVDTKGLAYDTMAFFARVPGAVDLRFDNAVCQVAG